MKISHKWFATIFVPEFRLQAALMGRPECGRLDKQKQPYALCEKQGAKVRVVECNRAARRQKVERGMTQVLALARCSDLVFVEIAAGQELAAQQFFLEVAEGVSAFVESTCPGVVTIALPPERDWCEEDLGGRLVKPLEERGWQVQVGMAQNPDLALLVAKVASPVRRIDSASEFLGPLPISALKPEPECLEVLDSWGIHTVGQLIALPQAEVCERLGPDAVELWERAQGGHQRALLWVKSQERFVEQEELENAVEMLEPLLFLIRRFLEQLLARLATVYLVPGKLRLVLHFTQGPPYEHHFTIPEPTGDLSILLRTLHTHLDGFTSDWPIVGLELEADPVRANAEQRDFFSQGMKDPHRFFETLARLQALLGSERVGQAQLEPSHHPNAVNISAYTIQEDALQKTSLSEAPEPPAPGLMWLRFRPPPARQCSARKGPASFCSFPGMSRLHSGAARPLDSRRRLVETRSLGSRGMGCQVGKRHLPISSKGYRVAGRGRIWVNGKDTSHFPDDVGDAGGTISYRELSCADCVKLCSTSLSDWEGAPRFEVQSKRFVK